MLIRRLLLNPNPAPEAGSTPPVTPPPPPAPETEKVNYKDLMARHNNDAQAAMIELWPRMVATTQALADLRAENAALRAKLPAEGAVLVPADKVALWTAVKDVADDPKEVARKLKDFPTVEAELAGIKDRTRKAQLAEVARIDGRKVDPEVFGDFFGDLAYVVKDETDRGSGKARKVLHVKHKDGDKEVETEFGEYVKAHKPKLIPSLRLRGSRADSEVELQDEVDDEDEDGEVPAQRTSRLPDYQPGDDDDRVPVRGPKRAVQQLIEQSGGRYGQ
jgi:hypothetical protein